MDAILIGVETALADDPALTARPHGRPGRDPSAGGARFDLATATHLPPAPAGVSGGDLAVLWARRLQANGAPPWLRPGPWSRTVALSPHGGLDLAAVLSELGRHGVTTLLVEGGGRVHAAFLRDNLYDQACLFAAPLFLGAEGLPVVGGLGLDRVEQGHRFRFTKVHHLGEDLMIEGLFGE